jgi:hypothetical protein
MMEVITLPNGLQLLIEHEGKDQVSSNQLSAHRAE